MDTEKVQETFRSVNRKAYPELDGYSREDIYRDSLGPGGLYLAARMTRAMELKPGDIVLDLGCGRGETSIYLAKEHGVRVVAVDLWTSATYLGAKFAACGYRQQIIPLHLDATGELPFAETYFDAIFCMNSLSFYGGSVEFLHHLLRHLRSGGILSVGSECFDQEFTPEEYANPPAVFSWEHPSGGSVWDGDFAKQHSPPWWRDLFQASGLLEVTECYELPDATILFEDQVLYCLENDIDPDDVKRTVAQLEYGYEHSPHQTIFVIAARKL